MKKIIITAFTLLVGTVGYVNAQTKSGNMMIGGGISLSSTSYQANDDAKTSSFQFTPQFGYFVADNFAVGLGLSLGTEKQDNGAVETKTNTWAVAPFARYYIFTSNDKFAFYGQASVAFGGGKTTVDPGNAENKESDLTFAVSPGFSYFFNEHWALDIYARGFSINSHDPNKDADDDKTTTVELNVNSFAPTFGVRYHF